MRRENKMPKFTTEHYGEIASLLAKTKLEDNKDLMELNNYQPYTIGDQWLAMRDSFVELFKRDNPLFREELFLRVCKKGE
jgi:hypothetical protein